ncbi:ABC transporter ATP-binding protein [Actinomadura sp. 7K507]|uniref:ABC transporter ATP-binding protein n=1 Tax=Actinomadura sp. 7K507 TaxID=2530365 RepID=UPI00104A27D2|nr:ABC transporter ATP-binding protein [Actinomadura sp. 7K507]TDC93005.1 ABC transporter ATP-binding protein [Actinomadura sp. 7K507]
MALLEARAVTVRFGGNVALSEVDLAAEAGQVTGLIGPNGAGKTTLFNVVSGLVRPKSGRVVLDGTDVTRRGPAARSRRGLGRTFQRLEVFGHLSVLDNLRVAAEFRRGGPPVDGILRRLGLEDIADVRADAVPTGRARLIELGRALAVRPKVLLLDEPASGQDEHETGRFGELLRELAAGGLAVVLVEHDMRLVMAACDVVHVLDLGKVIASGPPDRIRADSAVLDAYLGTAS